MAAKRKAAVNPHRLMQLGTGFWVSRAFLSAVELGVFTRLATGPLHEEALRKALGLHQRSARDFFDALVAMGVLKRRRGLYTNAPDAELFLDRNKPTYIGGILEMMAARLYGFWGALTEGLRTGQPQNESKHGADLFGTLYADAERLRGFLSAMTGISLGAARAMARKFPWKKYRTFCDVGGAQGAVGVQLALAHRHLTGSEFDLPPVRPIYEEYVRRFGLERRLSFTAGDFFRDPLPTADVLIMGHILHDWDLQQKQLLLSKAYAALPKNGALIVYEAMIDNDRSQNLPGLLMSLNMLIETPGGFDFTIRDCRQWMKAAGFRRAQAVALPGPDTMVIGYR
ncbi:MAG: methyltransferase [Gammaproteobacteria bacterium]|nr:methyltransferase [Gammaproteobacteria bacterium]